MLQPDKNFVTVCAVASLLHAQTAPSASTRPFLQVKLMLGGRLRRKKIHAKHVNVNVNLMRFARVINIMNNGVI